MRTMVGEAGGSNQTEIVLSYAPEHAVAGVPAAAPLLLQLNGSTTIGEVLRDEYNLSSVRSGTNIVDDTR
jgi:hypothetical protein